MFVFIGGTNLSVQHLFISNDLIIVVQLVNLLKPVKFIVKALSRRDVNLLESVHFRMRFIPPAQKLILVYNFFSCFLKKDSLSAGATVWLLISLLPKNDTGP